MKIIKAAVDLETWTLEHKCPHCESQLGIEAKDIYHDYDPSGDHWRVQCSLCLGYFRIASELVPKLVQSDATNNRYISHPSSDDWR